MVETIRSSPQTVRVGVGVVVGVVVGARGKLRIRPCFGKIACFTVTDWIVTMLPEP